MIRVLLCIFIIIGLHADELDYNYIEDDTYNEINAKQVKQPQQSKNSTKQIRATTIKNKNASRKLLDDRKESSGFMLGAGMTSGVVFAYDIAGNMGLNLLAGYKWFHTPGFGQRLYFDYSAGFIKEVQSNADKTHDLALNYDLLFNWVKTRGFKFGMLFGLNAGINSMNIISSTIGVKEVITFATGVNIGFRFGISKNLSIELLGQPKLLFGSYNTVETTYCDSYNGCFNLYGINPGISIRGILRYIYTF